MRCCRLAFALKDCIVTSGQSSSWSRSSRCRLRTNVDTWLLQGHADVCEVCKLMMRTSKTHLVRPVDTDFAEPGACSRSTCLSGLGSGDFIGREPIGAVFSFDCRSDFAYRKHGMWHGLDAAQLQFTVGLFRRCSSLPTLFPASTIV